MRLGIRVGRRDAGGPATARLRTLGTRLILRRTKAPNVARESASFVRKKGPPPGGRVGHRRVAVNASRTVSKLGR